MASRRLSKMPLETVNRSVFENQLEAFKKQNQEVSKIFDASAALSDIKPKDTPGFLLQYNTYLQYLDELISHFHKNQEIARKNQRNERLEIDCTPFLIFEHSLTRLFGMFLDREPRYDTEVIALSKLLTPLRGLVTIIKEKKINEINLIRFKEIEKIEMDLHHRIMKKVEALAKYNVEMTKSASLALCKYEENNLELTEKLRSKEKSRVQKYDDQLIYYGAPISYRELISRYEKKSNNKFPPSQQLIYLPPIHRESPALRALSDEAVRSASPVLNIPRARAPEKRASVPMRPSERPTQTPPRSPVHARILSKSRSSRRIGASGLAAPAISADQTTTPPVENQSKLLREQKAPSEQAPDEQTHADSTKESRESEAPEEPKDVDSLSESQESEAQTASETNPNESVRMASNPSDEDIKEQHETAIDNKIEEEINDAASLENLEQDQIPTADKKPEEGVSNEEEDMVIDKDIDMEPVENDDVEAERDLKEEDVESPKSSEAGTSTEVQVGDEVNPPEDVEMKSETSTDPSAHRRFPCPYRYRRSRYTTSPSISPDPAARDTESPESQLGSDEPEEGNREEASSVTEGRPLDEVKVEDVDMMSEVSSNSPVSPSSSKKSAESSSLSPSPKAVGPKSSESDLGDDESDEGNRQDVTEVRPLDDMKVENVASPESQERDDIPVQREAEAVQENHSGEDSGDADSSNPEDNKDDAGQEALESPKQPSVSPPQADSEDGENAEKAESSDLEDDEEPLAQLSSPEDPASLDAEAGEVSAVRGLRSSAESADDTKEAEVVDEPSAPEALPVQVPEEAPKEVREEIPEEVSPVEQEGSEDGTGDESEQVFEIRETPESPEKSREEQPKEVPAEDQKEEKTDDNASNRESETSPKSPTPSEKPILEDEPTVEPEDQQEESSEPLTSPESEPNELSVPNQEDPKTAAEAVLPIDKRETESCGTPHKRSAEPVEPEETPQKRPKLDGSPRRSPEQPPLE